MSLTNKYYEYRSLEKFTAAKDRKEVELVLKTKAQFLASNEVIHAINSNTIAPELKRAAILQTVISDFARRLLPLQAFSTIYSSVPLQGNNKVEVPYYELDSGDSQSFVTDTGYTIGDSNTTVREITVGEGATQGDRLYESLGFSSAEIARQPFLKIVELAKLKTDRLAINILNDIFSLVTEANYGAPAVVAPPDGFSSDKVVDLKTACKLWPDGMRSLVLDSAYDASLLKDPAFKAAYAAGTDRAIREGKLNPTIFGFDYFENPTIPDNGENLRGFVAHKSAILVAFAPVPPLEEVRDAGTTWEMFIEPTSGLVLEYRTFGDSTLDRAVHIIESNYGYAKGNGAALKRIVAG